MGFTEKLPNGKYRARWHDPTGRQRSLTFERERDAKKHIRNAQADIDRGRYVDDKAGKVTFGEWAEHYMAVAAKRFARTTYARDRSYLDNHVLPRWGGVKIARIARVDVDRWILELSEPGASLRKDSGSLAPATIERVRVHPLRELSGSGPALRRQAQLGPTRHHHTPLRSEAPH